MYAKDNLTPLQRKVLVQFIQTQYNKDELTNTKWMSAMDVNVMLMEYSNMGHSVVGLYNFIIWGMEVVDNERNVATDTQIMSTISHDLKGMHDHCFAPRSGSYENMEVEDVTNTDS